MKSNSLLISALILATAASSCKTESTTPAVPLAATTFRNLAADPTVSTGSGQPTPATGRFTFFSFRTGALVARTDSATNGWDLGFRGTTIITNGGSGGPGQGGALVQTGIFDEVVTAPTAGFAVETPTVRAIPATSGAGWYNYNQAANLITPIAGRVLLIRTGDGKFAKVEILSYYENAPTTPNPNTDRSRFYTFRYLYQPDGSRSLK